MKLNTFLGLLYYYPGELPVVFQTPGCAYKRVLNTIQLERGLEEGVFIALGCEYRPKLEIGDVYTVSDLLKLFVTKKYSESRVWLTDTERQDQRGTFSYYPLNGIDKQTISVLSEPEPRMVACLLGSNIERSLAKQVNEAWII